MENLITLLNMKPMIVVVVFLFIVICATWCYNFYNKDEQEGESGDIKGDGQDVVVESGDIKGDGQDVVVKKSIIGSDRMVFTSKLGNAFYAITSGDLSKNTKTTMLALHFMLYRVMAIPKNVSDKKHMANNMYQIYNPSPFISDLRARGFRFGLLENTISKQRYWVCLGIIKRGDYHFYNELLGLLSVRLGKTINEGEWSQSELRLLDWCVVNLHDCFILMHEGDILTKSKNYVSYILHEEANNLKWVSSRGGDLWS